MRAVYRQETAAHRSYGVLDVRPGQLFSGVLFNINGERARLSLTEARDLRDALSAFLSERGGA